MLAATAIVKEADLATLQKASYKGINNLTLVNFRPKI